MCTIRNQTVTTTRDVRCSVQAWIMRPRVHPRSRGGSNLVRGTGKWKIPKGKWELSPEEGEWMWSQANNSFNRAGGATVRATGSLVSGVPPRSSCIPSCDLESIQRLFRDKMNACLWLDCACGDGSWWFSDVLMQEFVNICTKALGSPNQHHFLALELGNLSVLTDFSFVEWG